MGLSNALSGGIVLFGITYVIFTFGDFTDTAASFSEVSFQTSDLESKLIKTSISISIENNPGTNETFDFDITNTNSEKLWDFENFDVIITYDSGGTTYTETQTYSARCPPTTGEWCINSWNNDVLDPTILNNGETITIRTEVSNNLQNNSDLIVIISTPNGIVATDTTVV